MVISFEDKEEWDSARGGIVFWATADGVPVRCFVPRETIIASCGPGSDDALLSQFRSHWAFRSDAAILIERGQVQKLPGESFAETVVTSRSVRFPEIIKTLNVRWPEPTADRTERCAVCDQFKDLYAYDDYSGLGVVDPSEAVLPIIANMDPSPDTFAVWGAYTLRLRECSGCAALFEERRYGLTAADNLFATSNVELRRVSARQAILLLRENTAIR